MATLLETPSRIWRRIEAVEDHDMPSLPSMPAFDDSGEELELSSEALSPQEDSDNMSTQSPIHSTPAAASHYISARARLSTSSATRFANSIARSARSSAAGKSTGSSDHPDSFDVSAIPSLPHIQPERESDRYSEEEEEESKESVPDIYLPPADGEDDEYSLADALQSISHAGYESGATPKKQEHSDYYVKLKPEPLPSPFDKFKNISRRRPTSRTRTPSLSRTTMSSASSSPNSTPQSNRSMPLGHSPSASPSTRTPEIVVRDADEESATEHSLGESDVRSMDITEAHISPLREFKADDLSESDVELNDEQQGQAGQSESEPETTFSSEGEQTPHLPQSTSAFASPATSVAFTPTPAFPRARARFNTSPASPDDDVATPVQRRGQAVEHGEGEETPLTPHTRRRSFLLSVINSTTRPRLKFPTPHPRNRAAFPETPITAESTPGPSDESTNLPSAFNGVTTRPRIRGARFSHPLAQNFVPSPGTSDSDSPRTSLAPPSRWATPGPRHSSLQDGSFVSTASSHDLTTHHRANTSFDPAMGFGAGAQGGVGKFNAAKLNSYLHGLNRRLQEENEALVDKLRKLEEEKSSPGFASQAADSSRRLSAGGSRRVSAGGNGLANVAEDVGGEGWLEEKAELEAMFEEVKEELVKTAEEKEAAERALEEEKEERVRDKERWKNRMTEVEQGVQKIVSDLEQRLHDAGVRAASVESAASEQVRELEKKLSAVEAERDANAERAFNTERALESGKELGGELRDANERVSKVMGDLRNANAQIKDLEGEVLHSDERIDQLEQELKEEQILSKDLEKELHAKLEELDVYAERIQQAEEHVQKVNEDLDDTTKYANELEAQAEADVARMQSLEEELAAAHDQLRQAQNSDEEAHERLAHLELEAQRASEQVRQMEEALEESETKISAKEAELADAKGHVLSLEREKQRQLQSNTSDEPRATDAEIEALEDELNDAHREIARLNAVLNQSPARKAIDRAKDVKIEILEKENEELFERVKALRLTAQEAGTPSKVFNTPGISPMHRQVLSMSFRAPRTPGAPLKDMSWLNATTTDPSLAPLMAELARLQRELDHANDSIDDKLDKLEEAGLGVVGLTRKLEDARAKIVSLEDEIARLSRREDRRVRRLERARCRKCLTKVELAVNADESSFDISKDNLPTEPPTPPTRTSEALRTDLRTVNSHLSTMKKRWEEEKHRLLGEKAALQDAANRLNVEVQDAKVQAEIHKAGQGVQEDLDNAKRTIVDLEAELTRERTRLRGMSAEQNRVTREKEDVLMQLQRTESDMDSVKQQLSKYKKETHEMENELRHNANIEQKARLLEVRVAENAGTIDQLREERGVLASDHKALQKRLSEITEVSLL
ncbi:hypothetical protein C8J56DRAFT_278799 [Mycena floridula]|nr:hypothetical protein C8J56DRAFT_278799 [Mycena floridula]